MVASVKKIAENCTVGKFTGKFSNSTQQTYCNDSGGIFVAMNMVENIEQ